MWKKIKAFFNNSESYRVVKPPTFIEPKKKKAKKKRSKKRAKKVVKNEKIN